MKEPLITSPEYRNFISELKTRVLSARISAARSVNRDVILLYWDIGRGIAQKQETLGWGKSVVETLAKDLRMAFPGMRGFSANNLWLMRQFYKTYMEPEFLAKAVAEGLHRESFPKRSANLEQPVQEIRVRKLKSGWESLEQLVQEVFSAVPWGHHVELLKKVKTPAAPLELVRLHQITEPAPEPTSRYPL